MKGRKAMRRAKLALGFTTLLCGGLLASGALGMTFLDADPTTSSTATETSAPTSTETSSTTTDTSPTTSTAAETTTTAPTTTAPPGPPTIASDLSDYPPGAVVTLTGTNWARGESVHINVNDSVGQTWARDVDVVADAAGTIHDSFNLPDWFVANYTVTARGALSGAATTTFTDALAATAVVDRKVSYRNTTGIVYTFSVTNTNANVAANTIRSFRVTPPSNAWSATACNAPAGWTATLTGGNCEFENGTLNGMATAAGFTVTASLSDGDNDVANNWGVRVSGNANFSAGGGANASEISAGDLDADAYVFEIEDAVVAGANPTVGAACPAANKTATAGTSRVFVICGRNHRGSSLTTAASAATTLGGTMIAASGTFTGGSVGANSGAVVLGYWPSATITSSTGAGKTVLARIATAAGGGNPSQTSPAPPTTLNGYEATPACTGAAVTVNPSSLTRVVGAPATFSVIATGTAPLSYQWRKGGGAISGANSSSYTISFVAKTDAGSYDVVVSNACGTATSAAAALAVNNANTSTSVGSNNNPSLFGQSVTFTATVTVNAPGSGTPTGTVTFKDGTSTLGTGTLSGSQATLTTASLAGGPHSITAEYGGDSNFNSSTSGALNQNVGKANQTITFGALADKTFGDADFSVSATASSGLTVSFAASGNCTVTGNTVHLTGAGSCTITASQGGNSNYNAAPDVDRTFSIGKANQTITFGALEDKTFGDADFGVTATASSGLTVAFSSLGNCTVTFGGLVHITGAGSCTITASQAGNDDYNAAPSVPQAFTIHKADQAALSVTSPDDGTFGQLLTIVTSGGSGSGALSFDVGGSTACVIEAGKLRITHGTGSCSVTASKAGDDDYNPVSSAAHSVTVHKADQTITIVTHAPGSKVFGTSFTVAATASSTLDVVYSSAGGCTNAADTFTMTSGTTACTVKYDQPGNGDYNGAPQLMESVTAVKADQAALSVTSPDDGTYNQSYDILTSGGSGTGALSFDVGASSACAIEAGKLKITSGTGSCSVSATKAGDANYNPVSSAAHPVTVHKADQATLSVTSPNDGTYNQSYDIVTSGGSGTGAVSFDVGTSSACAIVAGKLKITSGTGTCAVSASKDGDANYNPTSSAAHSVTVHKADQTINFAALANKKLDDPDFAVSATASSGLSVSFESQTTTVCTVSGAIVHLLTIGTCTIRASQSGDSNYNAAPNVDRSFSVSWVFHGFFQPVDNTKLNVSQAGSAIPVKFDLSGNQGLSIFAAGYPASQKIACDTSAGLDVIEETVTAGGSSLSYDSSANAPMGQYIYVWKTDRSWGGTCRRLDVKFTDGQTYSAQFQFKK
jgi:Bacterial Ig-like domain (group 3)/Immunoglobulin domain